MPNLSPLTQWLSDNSNILAAVVISASILILSSGSTTQKVERQTDDYIRTIKLATTAARLAQPKHTSIARAKLDTGCDINLINRTLVTRLGLTVKPLSLSDPCTISQFDRSTVELEGKTEIWWYGENPSLPHLKFRFGPQVYHSTLYMPLQSESPFDIIFGKDVMNKYRLDHCNCFSGDGDRIDLAEPGERHHPGSRTAHLKPPKRTKEQKLEQARIDEEVKQARLAQNERMAREGGTRITPLDSRGRTVVPPPQTHHTNPCRNREKKCLDNCVIL
ncbi:hypothetical protein EJ08DRAFT_691574 [Tothia fuscella]|uniref:Peptidase A2 domain-containing protein n=1 Tax=Tothia fuscella TaxID=1048955 RepID=A0A9P4U4U2_9PEZI|nr:hypothetical protein EJ08DRAFT_691574 [Tothia fuscella]